MKFVGSLFALSVASILALAGLSAGEDDDEESLDSFEAYLQEAESLGAIGIRAGPDYMLVDWAGLALGPQASHDLRALADGVHSGNEDGEVDEGEADDFLLALRELFTVSFGKYANHHAFSGFVLIDDAEAQKISSTHVEADGLVGPVDQEDGVVADLGFIIDFPNVDDAADIHTVRIDLGPFAIPSGHEEEAAELIGDLTLTVGPDAGWNLDADSVQPDCAADAVQGNRLHFAGDDIDCFTGHSGLLLSFAITGHGKSSENFLPGFEVPVLLGGLGAGSFALRRRK